MESGLVAEGSALYEMREQLNNSLRLVEDMVSTLQANVPELNQAKTIFVSEGLVLTDEIKWAEDVQEMLARCDNDFCVYEDFDKLMSDLNVSCGLLLFFNTYF